MKGISERTFRLREQMAMQKMGRPWPRQRSRAKAEVMCKTLRQERARGDAENGRRSLDGGWEGEWPSRRPQLVTLTLSATRSRWRIWGKESMFQVVS